MAKRRKKPDAAYVNAVAEMGGRCFRCGRTAAQKPAWWHAPFLIERSHIVNKPRREDRRAVIPLCSFCHRVQHGDRFDGFKHLEPLSMERLLEFKRFYDPDYFDLEWLQRHSVRRLPEI